MQKAIALQRALAEAGWAYLPEVGSQAEYRSLASELGIIVGEEAIALRPGAHAYVAKPGPVPLHTDHPEVDLVAWFCEHQDDEDGASVLLDVGPVVEALSRGIHRALLGVELWCPPVHGGPPTLRFPVLSHRNGRDQVFCSPWLRAASEAPADQAALDTFKERVSAAARASAFDVAIRPGDVLVVDNHRVLHGRRAIGQHSQRRLHRLWLRSGHARWPMPTIQGEL